jgi:hypothetical protein
MVSVLFYLLSLPSANHNARRRNFDLGDVQNCIKVAPER